MPIQSLPQEVVEVVVKFLPSKNDQSSMTLVSTYFLSLARPILFSSVRLPKVLSNHAWFDHIHDSNPRDYAHFVNFLTSSPELSFLIRQLTLCEWSDSMEDIDYELGPLNLKLLNYMLSELPSLRSLELRNVMFKTSDISVPYRYDKIDRLTIVWPLKLGDIMKPLAFFSHVCKLELLDFSISGLQQPPEPFEHMLKTLGVSRVFSDTLQISDLYLNGTLRSQAAVAQILLRTATPRTLRSFSAYCNERTGECHISPAVFDLLCQAAPTLTDMALETTGYSQPHPEYVETRDWQIGDEQSGEGTEGEARGEEDDEETGGIKIGDESDEESEPIVTAHDSEDDDLPDIIGFEDTNDNPYTYPQFDSHEMRTRLALLTSLRSLTLKFYFYRLYPKFHWDTLSVCSEAFAQMVPILASFPPCLRHITFSFTGSRIWPNNLRLLVPQLQRFEQLESVVFAGAEGITVEENIRVLNDLSEFRDLIRFRGSGAYAH